MARPRPRPRRGGGADKRETLEAMEGGRNEVTLFLVMVE